MDLNEIPSDDMVTEPIFEVESGINVNEVEKRCSDVEDKCLTLKIRNKEVELEEIRGKIRVLEGEKAKIEEEVKGLKEKILDLEGTGAKEAVMGELLLDGWNEEESKIDELMIENKVLECEKSFALKEVEKWKIKCGEFELLVRELEESLSSEGKGDNHDICSGVKKDSKSIGVGHSSKFGAGETEIEGTPSMGKQVKRRLDFCCDRSYRQKIAPFTPTGASVAFIDIDSDHDPDVAVENGLCLQSEVSASVVPDVTMDVEDEIGDEGNDTSAKTPKRKRDLTVVTSDDEFEGDEDMPKRRAFKIGDSDNEVEDDDSTEDALPIKILFKGVENSCQSDNEDNIPISQLMINRGRGTRRSVRLQKKNISGRIAEDHDSRNHPKRRLVKRGHKIEGSSDGLAKKYMEDEESEDDDSDSNDNVNDFIDNDTDSVALEDDLPADANHHSQEDEEASDDNVSFGDILSRIQRCKDPNSEWVLEPDMLSAFGKDTELCMRAVCAVYRRQVAKEYFYMEHDTYRTGEGFSTYDKKRGTELGDFLTDGNPDSDMMKTVEELEAFDPDGPDVCRKLAFRYSTQLFKMYKTKEDEFFP